MKFKALICFSLLFCLFANAQQRTINYVASEEDFPNPERGFYLAFGSKPGNLFEDELIKLRTISSVKSSNANYATYITLIYKGYLLTEFTQSDLSVSFLNQLQTDFDMIRKAGLKMVLRFSYTDKTHKGNCPDGSICPPYGDAPKAIVLKHIAQLKPLFQKNADIIAVVQQGFIGIWGENHYTDYFGDASKNDRGFIPDSSWQDRNEMLKALLNAVPKNRMVQVRTPQFKQRFLDGPNALVSINSTTQSVAFNKSDQARIAFHNDCFLASKDDYGTFADNGNSSAKKVGANQILRKYFEDDSKYIAVGGETCDDAFSPENDCAPLGYAQKEMAAMHYSFLNVSYNNLVNNDWQTQGCMIEIKKKLGYRFVLEGAILTEKLNIKDSLQINIKLRNEGYASPYNPRPLQLILRNKSSKKIILIPLKSNPQLWFSGNHVITEKLAIPKNVKAGNYEMLLSLPDEAESLKNRPEYSIRLANANVWEAETCLNNLNHTINIYK